MDRATGNRANKILDNLVLQWEEMDKLTKPYGFDYVMEALGGAIDKLADAIDDACWQEMAIDGCFLALETFAKKFSASKMQQIEAWLIDTFDDLDHEVEGDEVTIANELIEDLVRYDAEKKLFFKQGSPEYDAIAA